MNDLAEIKKRLFEEDKVQELLESIGCKNIKWEQGETLITAQLPDDFHSTNTRAVQCRVNEGLWCSIRNRNDFSGDIFNLISYLVYKVKGDELQDNLNEAKQYICGLFHWSYSNGEIKERFDPLKNIKSMMYKGRGRVKKPNKVLDENILFDFLDLPNKMWEDEGISVETQKTYDIGFDILTRRITVPVRNKFGQLVGVKGRMLLDKDVNESDPKYIYIYKCNQSQELFNFYIAHKSAKEKKELIIVEGEKSCMKFYENKIYNVVALGSSDISPTQVDMIYSLGFDIDIVLAYDSDKTIDEIQKTADKLNQRNVSMVFDKDKKTGKKSSPIDSGIEVWKDLYSNYKYDLE